MEGELIATPATRAHCPKCHEVNDVRNLPAFSLVTCAKCGASFPVPVMLGSFMLIERMGSGGMGAVYRALDTTLNRHVAVKVMKAALGEDAALVQSFMREARAAAALNHRNIVQIYSCGQESGQPFIVMELVTGGRLSGMFSREKPMDEKKLLQIAHDVAEGLQAANQAGLVHGDIKPENVLIDKHGHAKIVDFGLAQFVNAQKDRGEIWGTPYYISPERARGNKADHRSDIYSLGATMFHALAGEPPFEGETPADVVLARLKHPPPSLARLRPDLQQETVDVVERMMSAEPALRYPNPASLKSDINAAIAAAKSGADHGGVRSRKTSAAHLVVAAIAAMLLAIGGFWLYGMFNQQRGEGAAGADAPAAPTAKKAAVPLFTPKHEQMLVDGARDFHLDALAAADERLDFLAKLMIRETSSNAGLWVDLLRVVPLCLQGDGTRVTNLLLQIQRNADVRKNPDAVIVNQMARRLLEGKPDAAGTLFPSGIVDFPVENFMVLVEASRLIAARDWKGGASRLDAYLAPTSRKPDWFYAFDPLAKDLQARIRALTATTEKLDALILQRERDQAWATYREFEKTAIPVFSGALDYFAPKLKELDDQLERARQEAEQAVRAERIGRDLEKRDAVLREIKPMIVSSNNFRAALNVMSRMPGMETEEGRIAAQALREQVESLEGLKLFLYRWMESIPMSRRMGGDMKKAASSGIHLSVSGRTIAVLKWHEVTLDDMVQVIDFYSQIEQIPPQERAGALAGMAIYADMHQRRDDAMAYARRAIELHPDIRLKLERLAPQLMPAPTAPVTP